MHFNYELFLEQQTSIQVFNVEVKDIRLPIKVFLFIIFVISVSFISYSIYLKNNSPLFIAVSASSYDKRVVLVQVGNKSNLAKISIDEVFVNNNNEPANAMIQASNSLQGFIITNDFDGEEASKYNFKELKSVQLQTDTDPQKQIDKLNKGTSTEEDKIYAITIKSDEIIHKLVIKYHFLWLSYTKDILI